MSPEIAPTDWAATWGGRSHFVDIDGPVHWVEFGEPHEGISAPPLVLVHGLGGSHLDWCLVASALALGRRVVAVDLRGFGLTPGKGRTSRVVANARLLVDFLEQVVGEPAVLVGNSMGGMVSILAADRAPQRVVGLVLVDPSLPVPRGRADAAVSLAFLAYMTPGVGEFSMRASRGRISPEERVAQVIDLCFADSSRADPQFLAACTELLRARSGASRGDPTFLAAARSLMAVLYRRRRYASMMHAIEGPVLLINGEQDRLVPIEAARTAAATNPSWQTAFLPRVGHTPQLEVPERFVDLVEEWLATYLPDAPRDAPVSNPGRDVVTPTAGGVGDSKGRAQAKPDTPPTRRSSS